MTVSKQLIENIQELKKSLNEISVYDLNVYTAIELYYNIAKKLNEVITELGRFEGVLSDEVIKQNEKLIYLLGEGLNTEVIKKINTMITDGTFDIIINNSVFNGLNLKIDNFKDEVNAQFQTISNTVRYSQLGSIDELEIALKNGITVDLDLTINLNKTLTLVGSTLYTSNNSKIDLLENGQIIIKNNSKLKIPNITYIGQTSYGKPSIIITPIVDSTDWNINVEIDSPNIVLDNSIGSQCIQLLSENKGFWGLKINNPTLHKAEKLIVLKLVTENSWLTSNTIINCITGECDYVIYTDINPSNNPFNNCAGNKFINLQTQTTWKTKQHIYDLGQNIYTNAWLHDLGLSEFKVANKNKMGLISGANNSYYNQKTPVVSGNYRVEGNDITNYHRLGHFIKTHYMAEALASFKFVGPNYETNCILKINNSYEVTAYCNNEDFIKAVEFYTLENDDGKTVSVFMKLKSVLPSYAIPSLYENTYFIQESSSGMLFTPFEITPFTLKIGTKEKTKTFNTGLIKSAQLENGWTGNLKYTLNDANQVHLYGELVVGNVGVEVYLASNLPNPKIDYTIPIINITKGHKTIIGFSVNVNGALYMYAPATTDVTTGDIIKINTIYSIE